ncbi:MAG: radical SAM protein [Nitrospinae bacterium CG11_big_fil_rev_8_21_14_0_20_56_8]|nr:MAG: radical SAM protein [Nitrospinae bacterium CG11_big_fil_rev_8_21_14_0_20_56_8]
MEVKKLTSLIVEPTNTCNLRCSFCFVTEGMTRQEGFMSFDLFRKVIDGCPGLEHLCMHNWGEPLLNKDLFRMFDYARGAGIRHIVMNTNGTLLTEKMIDRIVASPLGIIRFSIDGSPETYRRVRGVELEKIEANILKLKARKDARRPALSMGVVFTVEEDTQDDVDEYVAYWETIVDHVRLQPRLMQSPRNAPCPEPFGKDYGKLVVLWDGRVIPCCVDYNATLTLGNAWEDRVADLWRGGGIESLRRQHEAGQFPRVCENCNECETEKTSKRFFFGSAGNAATRT